MSGLLSKTTVGAVGLLCKAFLNIGYCSSVTVIGLDNLRKALESDVRTKGKGVVTIANHISTLDDPVAWGILPSRYYFSSHMTRWILGASDIMFTNPLFSVFFRQGQVIETFRGNGIFQPAVDSAIEKLNQGAWIHLFGEGKVNQPADDSIKDPTALLRFKWGVGRILMETANTPIIIPMWLTGFDQLMPEGRSVPWKFFPKSRVSLSVTFGQPIDPAEVRDALGAMIRNKETPEIPITAHGGLQDPRRPLEERQSGKIASNSWLSPAMPRSEEMDQAEALVSDVAREIARIRSAVTGLLQRKVEELGREVMSNHALKS